MKTLLAILIISATPLLCFAQSDSPKEPNWQTFAPEKEEFATEVPVQLRKAIVGPTETASRNYKGKFEGTYFFVFSDRIAAPGATNFALSFARNNQPGGTPELFGDISSEKFEFGDDEGFYHRLFTFKTSTRIYVLQTVSPGKDDPLAERFFAKLQIGKIQPADNLTQPRSEIDSVESATSYSGRQANGTRTGIASGAGIGRGPGPAPNNPQAAIPKQAPTRPSPFP